jgi:16S rRNA (guanine966-N2)-methyltransferase
VVDLYAGTGALGIEALSRGAARATFVDSSPAAIRAIRHNLELTGLAERAAVRRLDVLRFLREPGETATLALADPPYDIASKTLDALVTGLAGRLTAPGWRFALTRPTRGYRPVIPVDWRAARELKYGDTLILVYEEV